MLKSHLLVEYIKTLPITNFTNHIIGLVENSVKFDLGDIENFDNISSLSKEDEFVNTPYNNCLFQISVSNIGHTYLIITEESAEKDIILMYFSGIIGSTSNYKWFAPDVTVKLKKKQSGELVGIELIDEYGNLRTDFTDDEKWWVLLAQSMCRIFPVLSCSNIFFLDKPPPKLINKKRKTKGKCQIHSYKILNISLPNDAIKKNTTASVEKRASPRLHLRRGHVRKLPSGERVWIQSCIVGDASGGTVDKDYVVNGV